MESVGVIGVGLVEGLILGRGLGEFLLAGELRDQGEAEVAATGSELDGLFVPGLGFGGAAERGECAAQAHQGLDILGLNLGPFFVVGDEAGLIVVTKEHLFDLAAHLTMEPAIGTKLAQERLEVAECVVGSSQPCLQIGGLHGELDLAEGVGDFFGEGLEASECESGLVFFGESRGDLLLDSGVIGEEGVEAVPDLEGLIAFLSALVDAAEGLEDFEEVVTSGLALESAFKSGRGRVGLSDQDERLPEIIGGKGIKSARGFGLFESCDGGGILAALEFEQSEDQPGGAVFGVFGGAVLERLDEGIERAAFDVKAVDAIEGGAASWVFFEDSEESLHGALFAGVFGGGGVGGGVAGGLACPARTFPSGRLLIEHSADERPVAGRASSGNPRRSERRVIRSSGCYGVRFPC